MKKVLVYILVFIFSLSVYAQNPKGFDKMCNGYIEGTVTMAMPQQLLSDTNAIILDARELKEYNVSHINGAIYVGYDNFVMQKVNALEKDKPVYVYCSIGYRSEKIGEQLQRGGFKNVYNLYGGIFNWKNSGFPVIDNTGKTVNLVHGYNQDWSKWINATDSTKVVVD